MSPELGMLDALGRTVHPTHWVKSLTDRSEDAARDALLKKPAEGAVPNPQPC